MSDSGDKAAFSMSERAFWWIRFWTAVVVVAGMALAGAQWGLTRVSQEDLDELDARKEDRISAKEARGRIEHRIDQQTQVVGNVRDNLIILMERNRLQPKPLPDALSEQP